MERAQIAAFGVALLVVVGLYILYEVRLRSALRRRLSQRTRVEAMEFGPAYYPDPSKAEVASFVVSKLQELSGVDLAGVLPSDEIVKDLHSDELDSLATVEILTEIETKFGVTVTDGEAAETRTIHELVELISAKREVPRLVG
jgi:acyl carrier protein